VARSAWPEVDGQWMAMTKLAEEVGDSVNLLAWCRLPEA
jgi:hypothetical protein